MSGKLSTQRPTIGLLIETVADSGGYSSSVWEGITIACRQRGINLICYVGGWISQSPGGLRDGYIGIRPDPLVDQNNIVYRMASEEKVDGLIINGALTTTAPPDAVRQFYEQYRPLPMVSIGLSPGGIPVVKVDNYGGMRNVITHLTQVHGARRIAFIRGSERNPEAEERYRAYVDVLTEYGQPVNPNLVAPGDFTFEAGVAAVRLFLDERKVEFEALVASNDNMASGALEELRRRGIRVPYDVALTGFDDVENVRSVTPPLTTVQQPMFELGKRAVETLFTLIVGESVPGPVVVPTRLTVRESCGCLSTAAAQAAGGSVLLSVSAVNPTVSLSATLATQQEDILFEIVQAVGSSSAHDIRWAERLLNAFYTDLDGTPGTFVATLNGILQEVQEAGEDPSAWHGAVSALRRRALPYLVDRKTLLRAEDLFHQSQIIVGEAAQRIESQRRLQAEQQLRTLQTIGQALITTFSLSSLADAVTRSLPQLGIPQCALSLYEVGVGTPTYPPETSRLVIAYDERGRVELEAEAALFPTRRLMPDGLWPVDRQYTLLVEPLFIGSASGATSLGFVVFEMQRSTGAMYGMIYEALRGHLSSALQGALLVQEVAERTRSLQEANYALQRRAIQLEASAEVARAITSIFDVDELFRKAVDLIRDRFGFYHAGIFLLDESGEWAVLREATGEAGATMKARHHRLAVGETSMVGWTAFHRKPRIALYAAEDAVRYANPLLPYTRSEMTLPMMVGDRLLGVLNVQSTEEAAFDDDDVRALQSMANQVAVAIENARQVSDETRLLEVASPIYRLSRSLAEATTTAQVADAIIHSVAELGADGCTVVEFEFAPSGEPVALLYRGVWRRDREVQFKPGMRLPISESPFPFEMVSTLWTVADVETDENLPESARHVFIHTGVKALANVPLRTREKVTGQVVVLRNTPGPFSDAALRLYEALSDQAAVALERAQLWEDAQRRAERERLTRQMVDHIRRSFEMEQALRAAAEGLARAMHAPHVSIELGV